MCNKEFSREIEKKEKLLEKTEKYVRYNDKIRMVHKLTSKRLSGESDVCAFLEHYLRRAYGWIILDPSGEETRREIKDGDVIQLIHQFNDEYLAHSSQGSSPVSKLGLITTVKQEDIVDSSQNWIVRLNKQKHLSYFNTFALENEKSGCYLYSHNVEFSEGNEVVCKEKSIDENNLWFFIYGYPYE